jgi:nitroimidazol reductase NimA-like FMN-containing flavoprotein (pyridoxamine 5'-phosphate oxidase superfamily)
MKTWHPHHPDKAITDPAELAAVVAGQKFLTLALCAENRPYLATLSHAFDVERNLKAARLDSVAIVRVTVTGWSGKKSG